MTTVYIQPGTPATYHNSRECAGKMPKEVTLEEYPSDRIEPCGVCVNE